MLIMYIYTVIYIYIYIYCKFYITISFEFSNMYHIRKAIVAQLNQFWHKQLVVSIHRLSALSCHLPGKINAMGTTRIQILRASIL